MDTERHEKHEYSCKCKDCSLFKLEKLLIEHGKLLMENARLRAELKTFQDPKYAERLKNLTDRAAESGRLLRENRELRAGIETPKKEVVEFTLNLNQQECPACKDKRLHKSFERVKWHPDSGGGFSKEHGAPPDPNLP